MDKKEKCEFSNQWAGSNTSWTSKAEVKEFKKLSSRKS